MLGSSVPLFHTESYSVSTMNDDFYVNINDVAKAKGLTSNRALRLEINKSNSKYIARKIKVNGGESYEILYSSQEGLFLLGFEPHLLAQKGFSPLYFNVTFELEGANKIYAFCHPEFISGSYQNIVNTPSW